MRVATSYGINKNCFLENGVGLILTFKYGQYLGKLNRILGYVRDVKFVLNMSVNHTFSHGNVSRKFESEKKNALTSDFLNNRESHEMKRSYYNALFSFSVEK